MGVHKYQEQANEEEEEEDDEEEKENSYNPNNLQQLKKDFYERSKQLKHALTGIQLQTRTSGDKE